MRRFAPALGRAGAACPVCGSLERHRLLWVYLERRGLARTGTVVVVAPDAATEAALRRRPGLRVISGDLDGERGQRRLDVTALDLPDGSVDLLLASHVLEHVADDAAAFGELRRVLRPRGEALLQVPLRDGPTIEDLAVRTPAERRQAFGQSDHVRVYGRDMADRVAAAGLVCELVVFRDELDPRERRRLGLVYAGASDPDADEAWTIVRAVRPE